MSIKARLKRLEKKVAAAEVPGVEIGVFAGEELWRLEERGGMIYAVPRFTDDEFERDCRAQQIALLAKCARMNDELGLTEESEAPMLVGADDQIAPGHVRPNFIFRMEGGKEIQIDTRSGERTVL